MFKIEEYCGEATKQHAEFLASRPQSGAQSSGLAAGDPVESSVGASNFYVLPQRFLMEKH